MKDDRVMEYEKVLTEAEQSRLGGGVMEE